MRVFVHAAPPSLTLSLTAALAAMRCSNFSKLAFTMILLAMLLPALLLTMAPRVCLPPRSSYPASLPDTAFVALALLAFTLSSRRRNVPFWLHPWGTLSLGLLSWGPPVTSGLTSPMLRLAPQFGMERSCFLFADMALATAPAVAK